MKEKYPQVGDYIQTPRFCQVQVSAVFRDFDTCYSCGFQESAHVIGREYVVYGKSIGMNRMIFAVCPKLY